MDFNNFKETQWLTNLGQPVNPDKAVLIQTLEAFFEEIYKNPYEDWCLEDINQASNLSEDFNPQVKALAEKAYLAAWDKYPNSEFCGLLSDDIETIGALLIIQKGKLRQFTQNRMRWYIAGRFPCGYQDNFPNGLWLVL